MPRASGAPTRATRPRRGTGRRRPAQPSTTPAASARSRSRSRSPCTRSGSRRAARTTAATTAAAASTSPASRPAPVREKTCLIFNTIGPDRVETMQRDARPPRRLPLLRRRGRRACRWTTCARGSTSSALPVRERYAGEDGWRARRPAREPGRLLPVLRRAASPRCWRATAAALLESAHWLQRRTKYGDLPDARCSRAALGSMPRRGRAEARRAGRWRADAERARSPTFVADVREEYFTALAHLLDSRYYRTHGAGGGAARRQVRRQAARLRGVDGRGPGRDQDLGLDAHHPRVLRLRPLLGRLSRRARARRRRGHACKGRTFAHHRAARARVGHAPPLSHQLAGDRRRGPRQPGRRASVQGLQRAAHAQRRAGRRRLDLAVPERVRLRARRPVDGRGRTPTTTATRSTSARRSPTPSTPPTWSTSRAACSGSPPRRRARSSRRSPGSTSRRWTTERRAQLRAADDQLRAAHADRSLQVHDRRVAARARRGGARASASARTWTSSSCARTRSSSSVDTARRRRARGRQRQRGQDRRQHAARAAPAGRARRRRAATCASTCGPGGNPGRRDFGGVVEAFTAPGSGVLELRNRFGEPSPVERAGRQGRSRPCRSSSAVAARRRRRGATLVDERLEQLGAAARGAAPPAGGPPVRPRRSAARARPTS